LSPGKSPPLSEIKLPVKTASFQVGLLGLLVVGQFQYIDGALLEKNCVPFIVRVPEVV
jgi:hypothetical protein